MVMDPDFEDDFIEMTESDFYFVDNVEIVPYLNNNGDIIQDRLEEIEKHTKSIQEDLISVNEKNIEFVDFGAKK